jgi:hypothetical protein
VKRWPYLLGLIAVNAVGLSLVIIGSHTRRMDAATWSPWVVPTIILDMLLVQQLATVFLGQPRQRRRRS